MSYDNIPHNFTSPMNFNDNGAYGYNDSTWANTDVDDFLYDSPQPESRTIKQETSRSESSEHSTSSGSSTSQRKRKPSQSSPSRFSDLSVPSETTSRDASMYMGQDNTYLPYQATMGPSFTDQDDLSLKSLTSNDMNNQLYGYNNATSQTYPAGPFVGQQNSLQDNTTYSPVMPLPASNSPFLGQARNPNTIQPSQTTFTINQSPDQSPTAFDSHESSPAAFVPANSPFGSSISTNDMLNNNYSNAPFAMQYQQFGQHGNPDFNFPRQESDSPSSSDMSLPSQQQVGDITQRWPCRMEVVKTPEKSRVETQIHVELRLWDIPKGITKVHLPAHTISKPKFQCKPPHERSEDTAELSAMLVCASAMQKDNLKEAAFERSSRGDIFAPEDENQPASTKSPTEGDANNPNKPHNGGPISICAGCISRERKRANRKKVRKQEEEDEWAKDEAKRVIVFNCAEVQDWKVSGKKEETVKDHEGPVSCAIVKAQMRIACYCRHQSEKIGFQVVFTLTDSTGNVLGQAISASIMITDDHKQPGAGHQAAPPYDPVEAMRLMQMNAMMNQGYGNMMPGYLRQPGMHRNSYSSPDLAGLNNLVAANYGNHYAPQRRPAQTLSRQASSGYGTTDPSTTSTTPRNLSRPPSPTNAGAPSAKKRRGGSSNNHKLPSGLTMTRMENNKSPTSNPGPLSAGPTSGGFNFAPHGFGRLANSQSPQIPESYSSGPSTPQYETGAMNFNAAFAAQNQNDIPFFSAPTSQQASRSGSPASAFRRKLPVKQRSQHASDYQNGQQQLQANALSAALSSLPPAFDTNNPPMIERIVPYYGHILGGTEVTLLGQGFVDGLEVCFGDVVAPQQSVRLFSSSAIVCKAPEALDEGQVAVVFRHQHARLAKHTFREMVRMTGVVPSTQVLYTYLDEGRDQMQKIELAIREQSIAGR